MMKKKDDNNIFCESCNVTFHEEFSFEEHLPIVHMEKILLPLLKRLKFSYQKRSEKAFFECSNCQTKFSTKQKLSLHKCFVNEGKELHKCKLGGIQ